MQGLPIEVLDELMIEKLKSYPLLTALCWQTSRADPTGLGETEIVAIYEQGWRWRGVLAEPSAEERQFIRELTQKYSLWLVNHV